MTRGEGARIVAGTATDIEIAASRARPHQLEDAALVGDIKRLALELVEAPDPFIRVGLLIHRGKSVLEGARNHRRKLSRRRRAGNPARGGSWSYRKFFFDALLSIFFKSVSFLGARDYVVCCICKNTSE